MTEIELEKIIDTLENQLINYKNQLYKIKDIQATTYGKGLIKPDPTGGNIK